MKEFGGWHEWHEWHCQFNKFDLFDQKLLAVYGNYMGYRDGKNASQNPNIQDV
jgi:hypothetical protein